MNDPNQYAEQLKIILAFGITVLVIVTAFYLIQEYDQNRWLHLIVPSICTVFWIEYLTSRISQLVNNVKRV